MASPAQNCGKLKEDDFEKIKKNFPLIQEQIDPDHFVNHFFSESIFSLDTKQEIEKESCRFKRVDKFLIKLLYSGPGRAYPLFMEILRKLYPHIAEKIDDTEDESGTVHAGDPPNHNYKFDVCISYSQEDVMLVKKLYNSLQSKGYRIWVDWEHAHGNDLEAMAEGVDQSAVVIICMSEKLSQNRLLKRQLSYADKQEKSIIPVLFQKDYTAKGWLGVLTGSEKQVDFTEKFPYNECLKKLLAELQQHIRSPHGSPRDCKRDGQAVGDDGQAVKGGGQADAGSSQATGGKSPDVQCPSQTIRSDSQQTEVKRPYVTQESDDMQELRRLFNEQDLDGNGKITWQELKKIAKSQGLKVSRSDIKSQIKQLDQNGDGKIDFEEFVNYMRSNTKICRASSKK